MKIEDDIRDLVNQARTRGQSVLTVSQYQRVSLHHDPCKGWLLVCVPMPDYSGALSRKLDESREIQIRLAASLVQLALRAAGETGEFGQPCEMATAGGEAYVFRWSTGPTANRQPRKLTPPPGSV